LLLKFYGRFGRFPRGRAELKQQAVEFVAAQLKVPAADLGLYDWDGPTIKRHRGEIRNPSIRRCNDPLNLSGDSGDIINIVVPPAYIPLRDFVLPGRSDPSSVLRNHVTDGDGCMTSVSSTARTLAALLSGREKIAIGHARRGVFELDSPRWPGVEVVYERASNRVGDGNWWVSWRGGPTVAQMRAYVEAAAEWIGTGRPLRGLALRYRRDLSDTQLALALDRAIAAGEYDDADLDAMSAGTGLARSMAEYRANDLDLREVDPAETAQFEALLAGHDGYSLGWLVTLLRARHAPADAPAAVTKSRHTSGGDADWRVCTHCGQPLPNHLRSLARYCTPACRQAAHRTRLDTVTKPRNTSCAVCSNPIAEPSDPHRAGRHSVYCSPRCRQLAYRQRKG